MADQTDNLQKHENYREQMRRLSHALRVGFYLEAIFIEYAVIEDRLESALVHAGAFSPKQQQQDKGESIRFWRARKCLPSSGALNWAR